MSTARGTPKQNVGRAVLRAGHGLEGDAHAGDWHRQVSLLSYEKVQEFNARGAQVEDGAFGENLLVSGFDFRRLPVGTRLRCGSVTLEITQIGKECHSGCEIYKRVGDCIMPREGVFARVLTGGTVAVGDEMIRQYRVGVITASDRSAAGLRADASGPEIERLLPDAFAVVARQVVPDDRAALAQALTALADTERCDLILTTGGTGFSPRDITPEATCDVCDRMAPGIAEAIRAASLRITPRAMLSRGVSGLRGQTLIINLPGSPKAVAESLAVCLDVLPHGLDVLRGSVDSCAR